MHDFVSSDVLDVCAECGWHRCDPSMHPQTEPAPVDWPARFRKAADVAEWNYVAGDLRAVADSLEVMPPDVVEAIGRELGGGT